MWIFSQHSSTSKRGWSARGFTLIELMVVISIVGVISTLILFNNNRFNSSILLRNLAYEVGLSLREAQLYGVAVKESSPGSDNFNSAYGVYFSAGLVGVADSSYPLFVDLNQNGMYDDGPSSVVENFSLQNGFSINNICAVQGSTEACAGQCPAALSDGATSCISRGFQWLAVTFKRPDPDALILTDASAQAYEDAIITVSSPNGTTRSTSVNATGQIVVQNTQ